MMRISPWAVIADLDIYTERKAGGTADDMSKEETEVTDELGSVTGSCCQ